MSSEPRHVRATANAAVSDALFEVCPVSFDEVTA
jgi:hypothetical protein